MKLLSKLLVRQQTVVGEANNDIKSTSKVEGNFSLINHVSWMFLCFISFHVVGFNILNVNQTSYGWKIYDFMFSASFDGTKWIIDASTNRFQALTSLFRLARHWECDSSSRFVRIGLVDCITWKLSDGDCVMIWSDGSSCFISALVIGICWRITLLPSSTAMSWWTCWLFGWSCSNRGMLGIELPGLPLASSAANSTGCAFFLWLRQLEPLAKVLSQNGHE